VTGGSRGIGRSTVVSLAKRHVDSIFTFNTHSEDAEAVIAEARAAGAQAIALQLDAGNITSFDGFVASVENALSQLGQSRFDFLVNTAGNSHHNMPLEKNSANN
jgi:NAD(P)-dependent dehydrogenase (short-subunit alcohol dehydrogenase family)